MSIGIAGVGAAALANTSSGNAAIGSRAGSKGRSWIQRRVVPAIEVEGMLGRIGFVPEALVASGIPSSLLQAVVSAAQDYLASNVEALRAAEAACVQAQHDLDRLEQDTRTAGADRAAALSAARTQRDAVRTASDAAFEGLRAAVADPIPAEQRQALVTIANNLHWELPMQYLVVERTQAQWIALRNALANLRISTRSGESPDAAAQQLVSTANADAAVAAAWSRLQSDLQQFLAAWQQNLAQ